MPINLRIKKGEFVSVEYLKMPGLKDDDIQSIEKFLSDKQKKYTINDENKILSIKKTIVIGRLDPKNLKESLQTCDLLILPNFNDISRVHCKIDVPLFWHFSITDLGSRFGTHISRIGDIKKNIKVRILENDQIRLGMSVVLEVLSG